MPETHTLLAIGAALAFVGLSFVSGATDGLGAAAGGFGAAIALLRLGPAGAGFYLLFPAAGFAVTQIGRRKKESRLRKQHETRSWQHALANTGAALIIVVLPKFFLAEEARQALFLAGLAAALSDTASSEIGMLSKSTPKLITTWAPVEPGEDGGVTMLGFVAGVSFAAALPLLALATAYLRDARMAVIVIAAAVGGNIADSVLGATAERNGLIDNHTVNFAGTGCAVVIAALALAFLGRLV